MSQSLEEKALKHTLLVHIYVNHVWDYVEFFFVKTFSKTEKKSKIYHRVILMRDKRYESFCYIILKI